jgi:hypothetical protein
MAILSITLRLPPCDLTLLHIISKFKGDTLWEFTYRKTGPSAKDMKAI